MLTTDAAAADSTPRIEQVAEGVWAYIQPNGGWMINNMGLIESADGATSVDMAATERRTRAYLDAAASVTAAPHSPGRVHAFTS